MVTQWMILVFIYIYSPHKTLYNTFDFDETHKGEDLPIWAFCESAESLVKNTMDAVHTGLYSYNK